MAQWKGKSKGSALGYKIFIFLLQIAGVKPAYALLKFISYYYFQFSSSSVKPIVNFYQKTLGMDVKSARKLTRINFYKLGQVLIDRFAFSIGKGEHFTYDFNNEKVLRQLSESGKGGMLISAHLGNWETAGNLLKHRITDDINVVMLDAEVEKIKALVNEKTGGVQFKMIPIKDDLSHVMAMKMAFNNNELVAMHGDRFLEGARSITCEFFGEQVRFPLGPFIIAHKFKVPVTFVYAFKKTDDHYEFQASDVIENALSPEEIAQQYVKDLEGLVKKYPEQWFNYYDFFKQ